MKQKTLIKIMMLTIAILIFLLIIVIIFKDIFSDSRKFQKEYKNVPKNNVYQYANIDKIIKLLDNETGIIYLCDPKSSNCKIYSKSLNEISKALDINKINYYNTEKFKNKKDEYSILIKKLEEKIEYEIEDYELTIPMLIIIKNGNIVGIDNSYSTQYNEIKNEIKIENEAELKEKIENVMIDSGITSCSDECK